MLTNTKHIDMSAQLRQSQALALRVQGKTWPEIAPLVGVKTGSAAFKLAQAALNHHVIADVEAYRTIAEIRLDILLQAVLPMATGYISTDPDTKEITMVPPDLKAVDRVIAIEDRRAKLFGLDLKPDKDDALPGVVLIREIAAPLDKV